MRNVRTTLVRDALLGVWFAVVGAAFWGPYAGLPLPDGTPLYGLLLTACLAALALRLTRRQRRQTVPAAGEGARRG